MKTLKDFEEHLYCSHIDYKYHIGPVYRATFSSVIRSVLHSVTGKGWGGGGCLLEGGRLLNILSLRRGVYSKGSAYLKLSANSSIHGIGRLSV